MNVFASDSLRCDGRLVSIKDTQIEVEDICGPATFIRSTQIKKSVKRYQKPRRDGQLQKSETDSKTNYFFESERSYWVDLDEWTYNFGSSRFVQTLVFENGKLISIADGSYGFDKEDSDEHEASKGDSTAVVFLKYGSPLKVYKDSQNEIRVTREFENDCLLVEEAYVPVVKEEWIYDFGPDEYLKKLTFKDDRLVTIGSLKVKGKAGKDKLPEDFLLQDYLLQDVKKDLP